MQVSFVIFIMATFTFLGMFLFIIFGGVGLFGLPLDFIHEFTRRPKPKNARQLKEAKKKL